MARVDKLVAYIKESGFSPRMDNFEHRLIIQKMVCLLELMGSEMGYNHSLYVRGPYSPILTQEAFENKKKVEQLDTTYKLSSAEKERIESIKNGSDNLNTALLEIMATYSFLTKAMMKNGTDATIILKRLKPFYSETQIAVGISRSKPLFPPSEKEVEGMKSEMEAWDAASNADALY
jgi:uncharacterized protein YwgA